ncbi:hypothetical protein KQX54_021333 [Cotesia glomerata]|uniref:Major facilitator superfamily (MFS) profile domain-containing protein n=1 Tax=Cotesia glomerata TaxID=32391 RepID=A0AAV7J6H7_COTGL|nr:hypothetical protein KQX54_021333 [Cotesia glomerata]
MENKEEKLAKKKALLKAIDDLGERSAFLWIIFVTNFLTMILFGLNATSYIFITEIPEFFCSIPELTRKKWTIEQIKNVSITNKCQKYDYNYTQFAELGYDEALKYIANSESNPHIIFCPSLTFEESGRSTIINEWDLVCDRSLCRPLTYSMFAFGMTFGSGILGIYADKHGRKTSLIISIILQTIVGPASALVPWFWAFIIFKFLTGVSIGAMYSSAYTILTEVARSKRIKVFAAILDATYSIGTYFVIGMAYVLPNWRHLQLAISCFILPMIILIWWIPESPKWLISQNRYDEAQKIIEKYCKSFVMTQTPAAENQTNDSTLSSSECSPTLEEKKGFFMRNSESLRILFTQSDLRKKILFMYFSYYVTSVISYSLAFNVDNFKSDRYIYLSIISIIDIIAHLTTSIILIFLSCRKSLIMMYVIGFIVMITILAVPVERKIIIVALALVSKFCFSVSFTANLVLNSELFPTIVRNTAFGTCLVLSQLGSMSAPFVVDILGSVTWWLPTTFCKKSFYVYDKTSVDAEVI